MTRKTAQRGSDLLLWIELYEKKLKLINESMDKGIVIDLGGFLPADGVELDCWGAIHQIHALKLQELEKELENLQ